jgi:aspartate dehydrogenase
MSRSSLKLGIAGLGAIGRALARKVQSGAVENIALAGVTSGDAAKAQNYLKEIQCNAPVLPIAGLAAASDVVVECAPAAVFIEIAVPVLELGKKFVALSAGQLLRHPELVALAKEKGGQIIVPTGALIGFDAVTAAAEGEIRSVTMVTRKPVNGLLGAPYLTRNNIDISNLTEPLCVLRGSAREAALGFPENVNVAAALSLAGIGPDRTTIEIWADPIVKRNMHHVVVEADSARFEMSIQNVPSENPKTGRITALSVLACLRKMVSPLRVGT